jgi:heterodisulfide reductase subunit C2
MTLRLVSEKGRDEANLDFTKEIKEKSGANLERCYQCVACSSGCPAAYVMDYAPHQIIKMSLLGLKDKVLNSNAYWLCLSCETCAARCPNEIDIVKFMDTLREMAIHESRVKQTTLPLFHETFLGGVRRFGKTYEIGLILQYMLKSREIFNLKEMLAYIPIGLGMFLKGKLVFIPDRIKGTVDIKRIFSTSGKRNG